MTPGQFEHLKNSEAALMLYFFNDTCGVCNVLWPKISKVFEEDFPKIKVMKVYAPNSRELAGQMQMLSVPGIVIFFDGREFFRGNGMISLAELRSKTTRAYEMFFGD
jgi:thioredoxin-like negative regulator of GroEL